MGVSLGIISIAVVWFLVVLVTRAAGNAAPTIVKRKD
jgi:hypothetical protein